MSDNLTNAAQSRFRKLTLTAVGGADAEKFSIGAEDVAYEGPLQLRLQVCKHSRQVVATMIISATSLQPAIGSTTIASPDCASACCHGDARVITGHCQSLVL